MYICIYIYLRHSIKVLNIYTEYIHIYICIYSAAYSKLLSSSDQKQSNMTHVKQGVAQTPIHVYTLL
jgi:hypothetical protein